MTDANMQAALRMWLDSPNLMASYERRGIVIITVALRTEAATAAAEKMSQMIADYRAAGFGDPERLDIIDECVVMMREVLRDNSRQVLPLDLDSASPLGRAVWSVVLKWFGASWGAPVCAPEDQTPVPVDRCVVCEKQFFDDDQGIILPFVGEPDDPTELAYHLACFREALGIGKGT